MDSENPITNFAPVLVANEENGVDTSTSAGISNDTALDEIATTPMESKKESEKRKAMLQKGKIDLKENKKTEKKRKAAHLPTSEMAIAAIKELKKRNGASLESIHDYIEHHYVADMKRIRQHLKKFLVTGVEKGILERLGGPGAIDRFKMKGKQTAKKGTAKEGTVKEGTAKKGTAKKGTAKKGTAKKGDLKEGTAKKEKD